MDAQQGLAIFDFDGTMLKGDSIVSFLSFAYKRKKLSFSQYFMSGVYGLLHKLGFASETKAKSKAFSFIKALSKDELSLLSKEFVEKVALKKLFPKALDRLLFHRGCGDIIVIISASPMLYMQYLKEFLPINDVIASACYNDGVFFRNVKGSEKTKALKKWLKANRYQINWQKSYAYGNSKADIPVMSECRHPVFINASRSTRNKASDWKAENWSK